MDALIRQMRTRSRPHGPSQPEEGRDGVNRASSRTGEKINKSWFQRQYSNKMNGNDGNHTSGGEDEIAIAIAIAAAAYAVDSLDEPDRGGMISQGDSAFVRAKSKRETIPQQEPYGSPKPFSGQQEPPLSLSSKGIYDGTEHKLPWKPSNVGDGPVKTVQKRPTFAEKLQLDRTNSGEVEQPPQEGEDEDLPIPLPKPKQRSTSSSAMNPVALPLQEPPKLPPKFPATKPGNPPLFEIQSQARTEPTATRFSPAQLENSQQKRQIGEGSMGGAPEADAWERDEMNRIRVKYEKLSGTIAMWEDDKKKSTRRKLDENEREIERRRVKAQKEFRTEMERIVQIAGGARAQADERRKREEAKTREKAERIRRTGKARSNACSCF